jgi:hypothetical protein
MQTAQPTPVAKMTGRPWISNNKDVAAKLLAFVGTLTEADIAAIREHAIDVQDGEVKFSIRVW